MRRKKYGDITNNSLLCPSGSDEAALGVTYPVVQEIVRAQLVVMEKRLSPILTALTTDCLITLVRCSNGH